MCSDRYPDDAGHDVTAENRKPYDVTVRYVAELAVASVAWAVRRRLRRMAAFLDGHRAPHWDDK